MKRHDGEKAILVWLREDKVAQLDAHLPALARASGIPGAKVSRHGFIRELVYRELDAAAEPEAQAAEAQS